MSLTKNDDFTTPFAQWEEVEVTFPAGANTDMVIQHSLQPANPENINYIPLRTNVACAVYHDTSVTRKKWQNGYIILRCSTANAKMRLLLTVGRSEVPQTF